MIKWLKQRIQQRKPKYLSIAPSLSELKKDRHFQSDTAQLLSCIWKIINIKPETMYHNSRWNTAKPTEMINKNKLNLLNIVMRQQEFWNGPKIKNNNNKQRDNNYNHR